VSEDIAVRMQCGKITNLIISKTPWKNEGHPAGNRVAFSLAQASR
jgi:hypothetical protein